MTKPATREGVLKAIAETPRAFLLNAARLMASYGEPDDEEDEGPYALINVWGVLSDDPWIGDTPYGSIRAQLIAARDNDQIRGVLMRVNSPGGETDGAYETADLVAEVAAKKPVIAVADPSCYSAAYMLASQASRIVVQPESGGVGSIGVYGVHFDYSGMLEKAGIGVTIISAGEHKTDGNPYEPLTDDVLKAQQDNTDRLYQAFVSRVARGRKMSEDEVRKLTARPYDGATAAISSRLADSVGSLNDGLSILVALADAKTQVSPLVPVAQALAAAINPAKAELNGGNSMTEPNGITATAASVTAPAGPQYADAEQIVNLCTLAGKPARAGEFLKQRKSAAEVSAILLAEQAEQADSAQISTISTATQRAAAPDPAAGFSFANFVRKQFEGGKA